jgi:RNA polymerase sigma-54 factor
MENPLLLSMDDDFSVGKSDGADDDASSSTPKNEAMHSELTPLWKSEVTLHEHLESQIRLHLIADHDRAIAFALMNHLDENGFLDPNWASALDICQLKFPDIDSGDVEAVLEVLQQFDPPGIFARSVLESLTIQMKMAARDKDYDQPWRHQDIDKMMLAFETLKTKSMAEVCAEYALNESVFYKFLSHLRSLEFNPAQGFGGSEALVSRVPEVRIHSDASGDLSVSLNPSTLPRVLVNSAYYQELRARITHAEELNYLKEKFTSANWLIQSLQKRTVTLMQVASEIVQWQADFFGARSGPLRPMTLKDIAQNAGVHESTVSRITTAKYIDTPRGLFEMKALFANTVGTQQNGASSVEIQNALKALVTDEPRDKPLSDEDFVALLGARGLNVARRTIAKYRTILGIASSSDRKRHYKMQRAVTRQTLKNDA